mgnify:CR=1 FL=1
MKKFSVLAFLMFALASCKTSNSANENCGDNVVDVGEECDGIELNGASCESAGYYTGAVTCNSDCTLNLNECGGSCGDAILQEEFEQCDGALLETDSCIALGYHGGALACNSECQFDISACVRCGDSAIQSEYGEECEGEDLAGATCITLGHNGGTLGCTDSCHGMPPKTGSSSSTGAHAGVTAGDVTACNGCHADTTTDSGNPPTIDTTYHINGSIESSGCTGCHGTDPKVYPPVATSQGGSDAVGAHVAHIENTSGFLTKEGGGTVEDNWCT